MWFVVVFELFNGRSISSFVCSSITGYVYTRGLYVALSFSRIRLFGIGIFHLLCIFLQLDLIFALMKRSITNGISATLEKLSRNAFSNERTNTCIFHKHSQTNILCAFMRKENANHLQ